MIRAQLARVAAAVVADEAADPVGVGLLGPVAVVADADLAAELAEEGAGVGGGGNSFGDGACRVCHFH